MMKTVRIITFGCKVNQYESEYMAEQLERAGFVIILEDEASYYLVNSCAVTEEAEKKVKRFVKGLKKEHPNARIILTGCYAQLKPEEAKNLGVNLVLGVKEKRDIVKYISNLNGKQEVFVSEADGLVYERVKGSFEERTRAYIKVEDGCDNACTYCVIRLARGRKVRSKPVEVFLQEFLEMLEEGYKEIVITGVNLGKYGKDMGLKLADLLRETERYDGDYRIRLSSINVEDIDEDFLEAFSRNPRLCHHLHISLQSGSDKVLKRMGRRYSVSDFLRIVDGLRRIDEDFSITTDIIVGFPGETDEDFEQTLRVVDEVNFSRIHVFRFSPRPGTPASSFLDQVCEEKKRERLEVLKAKAEESSKRYREKTVGKTRIVLAEGFASKGVLQGYDEYYVRHEFVGEKLGRFYTVRVKSLCDGGVISCRVDVV